MPDAPVLFLDTASPVVSVAVGGGGTVLAQQTIELRRSSEHLLTAIEAVLTTAGLRLGGLSGIAAFQGPGSFTGLRIGLATALGLHQASGIPATAVPTLPLLAAAGLSRPGLSRPGLSRPGLSRPGLSRPGLSRPGLSRPGLSRPGLSRPGEVVAAVDAIRGEWMVQRFRDGPTAVSAPELLSGAALAEQAPCRLIGFGVDRLAAEPWAREPGVELVEPPPLAPVAARRLSARSIDWQVARLTSPIYFRPPAVTRPPRG